MGRFVKYISYPFWAKGSDMPDSYNLKGTPPADVIENVQLFVEGKATFHELPRKQGRKHRVIRTIIGGEPLQSGGARSPGCPVPAGRSGGGTGGSILPDASAKPRKKQIVRRRQLPSKGLSESSERRTGPSAPISTPVKTEAAPKVLPVMEPKGTEVTVKVKAGRPRRST